MIIRNFAVAVCFFLSNNFLALISPTIVISAAHCFDPPNAGNTKIAVGRIDLNNANQGCMYHCSDIFL